MSLSQDQWLAKLKSWVPTWYFVDSPTNNADINLALFKGMAKVFATADQSADDHQRQTFILQAETLFLDLHGDERNDHRLPRETNPVYARRVQSLLNKSNGPALIDLVNEVLIVGQAIIREHDEGDIICLNRGSFLNRKEVFTNIYYNTFTIIVERQIHEPYSFFDRGYFLNRGNFFGSNHSDQTVFDLIIEVVNNHKAAGTLYRVLERN